MQRRRTLKLNFPPPPPSRLVALLLYTFVVYSTEVLADSFPEINRCAAVTADSQRARGRPTVP